MWLKRPLLHLLAYVGAIMTPRGRDDGADCNHIFSGGT